MRITAITLLLASGALAGTSAGSALERGEKALEAARNAEGTKLLRALEGAKPHFKRARGLAARGMEGAPGDEALKRLHEDATNRLVAILNAETAIYLDRGARKLAAKRNVEALALLPKDARAKALEDAIANPEPYVFDASMVHVLLGNGSSQAHARPADSRYLGRRAAPRP
jgi:hypothetical protein